MADQSFIDWLWNWAKGPRSTRTARLIAKNKELHEATEKFLVEAELERRGLRHLQCEACQQPFESSVPLRRRCNSHYGDGRIVRLSLTCKLPGCIATYEHFSNGRDPLPTRCPEHVGRTAR